MFKKVKINSFRGISSLEIDDLRRINLFVGKNNCGKTSVLEGIYLLSDYMHPQKVLNINRARGLMEFSIGGGEPKVNEDMLRSIFYNLDANNYAKITGYVANDEKRELVIRPHHEIKEYYDKDKYKLSYDFNTLLTEINGFILEYTLSYPTGNDIKVCWEIEIQPPNIVNINLKNSLDREKLKRYIYKNSGIFISPRISIFETADRLKEIQKNKQTKKIAQILKKIENRIKDLQVIDNIVYCDVEGVDSLVPVNIMGDGILKILSIITSIYNARDGYVFIDEIENGLHYSSLEILWRGIFEASKEFNVQIFATTHSWECIDAYRKVYDEYANEIEGIKLYRIEKEDDSFLAIDYDEDSIKVALEEKWEVR